MPVLLAMAVVVAQLGGGFEDGEATGSAVTATTMEVDVGVALRHSDGPVVAHLWLPGEEEQVTALAEQDGGRWGTVLELRRADWVVVFEDLATGQLSREATLTGLGIDATLLAPPPHPHPQAPGEGYPVLAALLLATAAGIVVGAVVWTVSRERLT